MSANTTTSVILSPMTLTFDYSVLSEFRSRLIAGEAEHLLLDKLLARCRTLNVVKSGGALRTDSTHIVSAVRNLNRLELVGEALRAALNDLAEVAPEWLQQTAPSEWYERYGRRIENYRLPSKESERIAYAQQIGEDGDYLLKCLAASEIAAEGQALDSVQTLTSLWQYHYSYVEGEDGSCLRWKSNRELSVRTPHIASPYDTEARYCRRQGISWVGYRTHLSETCDDDSAHLITHVMTTDALRHESQCIERIHDALIAKQLPPKEHYVDAAYVDALLLVSEQAKGIETVGPARSDPSWQHRTAGAYSVADFKIDWQKQQVSCPQGKTSSAWGEYKRASGDPYVLVRFNNADCRACSVRALCTRAKLSAGRTLHLLPQAAHNVLTQVRAIQETIAGQKRYRRRAGIEGTIAQGVSSYGLRRSRYIGLAKTHLQNMAVGAAMNIDRLFNWFTEVPLAKTRVSRFRALKTA